MSDAEMLLGPVGSNLIPLLYAPAGCPLIELIPDPSHNESTGIHSRVVDVGHEYFLCEPAYYEGDQHRSFFAYDLIVDCDKLDKVIRARLGIRG